MTTQIQNLGGLVAKLERNSDLDHDETVRLYAYESGKQAGISLGW
jgi:hypothetical protein